MLLRSRSLWEKVNYVVSTSNMNLEREEYIKQCQLWLNHNKCLSRLTPLNIDLKSRRENEGWLMKLRLHFIMITMNNNDPTNIS